MSQITIHDLIAVMNSEARGSVRKLLNALLDPLSLVIDSPELSMEYTLASIDLAALAGLLSASNQDWTLNEAVTETQLQMSFAVADQEFCMCNDDHLQASHLLQHIDVGLTLLDASEFRGSHPNEKVEVTIQPACVDPAAIALLVCWIIVTIAAKSLHTSPSETTQTIRLALTR